MKTAGQIRQMKGQAKVAMLTVYDYPTACILDRCGLDILFVGDTLGQVELGFKRTSAVTIEMMLHHLGAVRRGVGETHLLADMPYQSYAKPQRALQNARKLLDAGADSVKLEGAHDKIVAHLVDHGIDVVGHVGLLPQTARRYVRQGTKEKSAERILKQAVRLAQAGCYAVVLEHMPSKLAREITEAVLVPTIGIGAGPDCDGQVLVVNDMLGLFEHAPYYVKRYANLFETILKAGEVFGQDVKSGSYPSEEFYDRVIKRRG